jgi:hypothetical protein
MKPPTSPRAKIVLLLPLLAVGCSQNGYVRVTVEEVADGGQGFPAVFQIRSIASDADGGTPSSMPGPLQASAIVFPKTFVVEVPPTATSLLDIVEGLDENNNVVLRGSNSTNFSAGSQATSLQINLTPACNGNVDCNPAAFCAGQVVCTPQGACVATAATVAPGFGTACGDDGGRCDEQNLCVTDFSVCGDGTVGLDPLPDGGTFQEQCDWGTPELDGGCVGPDGGCNSDTLANHCRTTCVNPYCGDGVTDTGEKCDKGSGPTGNGTENGCNATCTLFGNATLIAGNGDVTKLPDGGSVVCNENCYVDGACNQAQFQQVSGIAVVGNSLYVADTLDEVIRAVDISGAQCTVSTLAGNSAIVTNVDGCGTDAGFFLPFEPMAYQGMLLVGTAMNVREMPLGGSDCVTTFAGPDTGNQATENNSYPVGFGGTAGCDAGQTCANFNYVTGLCTDPNTGLIYTVDNRSNFVHELDPVAGLVYLVGGTSFQGPTACVVIDGGLYLTDTGDEEIKRVNLGLSSSVVTVAGDGTAGYSNSSSPAGVTFSKPQGMCTDGQTIYIVDSSNAAIRQMDPITSAVTTVVGGPDAGVFRNPYGCAWDPATGTLYVSDQSIPPATPDGVGNVIYMVQ